MILQSGCRSTNASFVSSPPKPNRVRARERQAISHSASVGRRTELVANPSAPSTPSSRARERFTPPPCSPLRRRAYDPAGARAPDRLTHPRCPFGDSSDTSLTPNLLHRCIYASQGRTAGRTTHTPGALAEGTGRERGGQQGAQGHQSCLATCAGGAGRTRMWGPLRRPRSSGGVRSA